MTTKELNAVWPVHLQLQHDRRELVVEFDDGTVYQLPAELLRVESPSAEVQGHGAFQKQVIPGCRDVTINEIEPVGNYAVRIIFDDDHDTGIYSWSYLYELGEKQNELWKRYLEMLDNLGLSR